MTPIISADVDIIRENYEILELELEDTLGNSGNLFSTTPLSDVLSVILGRLDAIRVNYQIDSETCAELRALESSIFGSVLTRFKEEFPEAADNLETNIADTSMRLAVDVIYRILYLSRKIFY